MCNSLDMASRAQLEFSQETIQIRLFGELSIYRAGRRLALPASKKTRALLAYLVTSAAAVAACPRVSVPRNTNITIQQDR